MEIGRQSIAVLLLSVASVVLVRQLQTWYVPSTNSFSTTFTDCSLHDLDMVVCTNKYELLSSSTILFLIMVLQFFYFF